MLAVPKQTKVEAKPPSEAGDPREAFLKLLLKRFGWDYGELWLVDREADLLRLRNSVWTVPAPESRMQVMNTVLTTQRSVALPGGVWSAGSWIWVPDVAHDADFKRAPLALADGLTSSLTLPLVRSGVVNGVVQMFSLRERAEEEAQAEAVTSLAQKIYRSAWNSRATTQEGNRFRHLIEGMSDIAAVLDLEGTILYESAAVTQVLGYRLEERLGHNVFEFIHPDDQESAGEAIRAGFQNLESVHRVEVRARHKDGSWIWLETLGHVEADEDGGHVIVAVSRDVTEAKAAQEALLQRDQRLTMVNTIAKELIAGKSTIDIIGRAIFHLSRHHPYVRVTYWTISAENIMTVTHSAQPLEMQDITGLTVDLSIIPAYLQALRSSRSVAVEDVFGDARLAPLADAFRSAGSAAIATASARHSRGLLGQISFASVAVHAWSDHEISTLEEVADMLSIALREAQHLELRRMAEKNLRRAAKDVAAIFEAFPELGQAGAGGAGNVPGAVEARRRPTGAPTPPPPRKADHNLSGQDLHVLALVAAGLTNKEIGSRLSLSPYTVKHHVKAVMSKLGAKNRTEAVVIATKRGIV